MSFGPLRGSSPGPGRAPQTLAWNGFYGFFQEPHQNKGCEHIQNPSIQFWYTGCTQKARNPETQNPYTQLWYRSVTGGDQGLRNAPPETFPFNACWRRNSNPRWPRKNSAERSNDSKHTISWIWIPNTWSLRYSSFWVMQFSSIAYDQMTLTALTSMGPYTMNPDNK